MNKYLKYTLKGLGIVITILVLGIGGVYLYINANKQSIIKQVTTEISSKLNGDVKIGGVDLSFLSTFPSISVKLNSVSVTDTLFKSHNHTFFKADQVFVKMGIGKLIRKKSAVSGIRIEKGNFYLYTDTSGYTNKYLFSPKSANTQKDTVAKNSNFRDIDLVNVRIIVDDELKRKYHDLQIHRLKADIDDLDDLVKIKVKKNDILVHSLIFNPDKGGYIAEKTFKGDMKLRFDKKLKQLQFDSIDVFIGAHPFNLTGRFDISSKAVNPQMLLRIHTKKIGYEFVKTLLPAKIGVSLSMVELDSKLDAYCLIAGPLKNGEPLLSIDWVVKNTKLKSAFLELENCSFKGNFFNEVVPGLPRRDPNSRIILNDLTGEWNGLKLQADTIRINDLKNPTLVADLYTRFPLKQLNDILNTASISFGEGEAIVNMGYNGPMTQNNSFNTFINGSINIKNGMLNYNPRDIPLKNVNGKILFRNSDVVVDNLQCLVLGSNIVMSGNVKNALSMMNNSPAQVLFDWNIYSPSLNLGAFTFLLKQRKKLVVRNAQSKFEKASRQIDDVLEKGSVKLTLRADELKYRKFSGNNALVDVSILPSSWIIHKISLQHAGGQMDITGSLQDKAANNHQANAVVGLQNVDISRIMAAFNNFGQDGITSASIRGKLSSKVNLSMQIDDDGNVSPNSLNGMVDFSLKQGELINYEPIKKIQDIIFKKRDFDNIQFAELKNKLVIRNQEITINRMEIQSSVISMFVEGLYSRKGNTDISIQVPLKNLKKRDANFVPENIGTDQKVGPSVFIRGTPGSDGNIKFKYDMFKKFRSK